MSGPRFSDINHYYAQDERRRNSGEVDFGVMWREEAARWPTYRVSWVMDTGDFYAVCQGGPRAGEVEHLGRAAGRELAERVMDGWAEVEPMMLTWVRERMRG